MLEEKHSVFGFRFPRSALPIQMNLDLGLGLGLGHRQFSCSAAPGITDCSLMDYPPATTPLSKSISNQSPKPWEVISISIHSPPLSVLLSLFKFSFLHLASNSLRYGHLSVQPAPESPRIAFAISRSSPISQTQKCSTAFNGSLASKKP